MAVETTDEEKPKSFFGKLLKFFKKILKKLSKDESINYTPEFYVDLDSDKVNSESDGSGKKDSIDNSINNEFVSVQKDQVYGEEVDELKEQSKSNESYDTEMDDAARKKGYAFYVNLSNDEVNLENSNSGDIKMKAAKNKGLEIMQRRRESLEKNEKKVPPSYNDKNSISDKDYNNTQIKNLIKSYAEKIVFDISKRRESKINQLEGELKNYEKTRSELVKELEQSQKKLQQFNKKNPEKDLKDGSTTTSQSESKVELKEKGRGKIQKTNTTEELKITKAVDKSKIVDRMESTIINKESAIKSTDKRISKIGREIDVLRTGVTVEDVELAIEEKIKGVKSKNQDVIKNVESAIKSVGLTVGGSHSVLQKNQVTIIRHNKGENQDNISSEKKDYRRRKLNFEQQEGLSDLPSDEKEVRDIYRNKVVKGTEKPLTIKDIAINIQNKMLAKPIKQEEFYKEDHPVVGTINTSQVEEVNHEKEIKSRGNSRRG